MYKFYAWWYSLDLLTLTVLGFVLSVVVAGGIWMYVVARVIWYLINNC